MRQELPTGTITFLFTDVEGSTKLLHELGEEEYAHALATHRRVVRAAFSAHGGVEVDTQGDAFFVAFATAPGALRAAAEALDALTSGPIRVRMGIHTGTPYVGDEGYIGADVHRAARIAAAGHGGQVLVSASTASLVDGGDLRDLGEHRLKDLSGPERLYQLGDGEFPPLKSLHQTNLPVPATAFLGRERELEEVVALLARDDVRLVTLTGPGGTGKTRLALQTAGAAADAFPAGTWWVPLAPLRDAAVVLDAAAQALGAPGDLAEHIAEKSLLLLFDNFEHVIGASWGVSELLQRCPQLTVLVTSREPLRLAGEWEYAVDPLAEREALELFDTRARAARRDFTTDSSVREICARLDNLPLAIELAAARVKVLSTSALLARLEQRLPLLSGGTRDAPERQRTLRAAIAWSHDLLAPEEQVLFRRFGVFAGGATLEAAEEVCDADLGVLASLVDKSLLRQAGERFWMLETIREFAVERLAEAGETQVFERRHADYFLALAEAAEPHLGHEDRWGGGEWFDRLDAERDNIRLAFDRLEASRRDDLLVRLAAAAWRFWQRRLHLAEGRRLVDRALRAGEHPVAARAKVVLGAANLATNSGDPVAGIALSEEALSLHRELADTWGTADCLWMLGYACAETGDWQRAQQLVAESARLFGEIRDEHSLLWVTRTLAWIDVERGNVEEARTLHEENLRRARALGNRHVEAIVLGALAMLAVDQGRVGDALALLTENTPILRELGDDSLTAANLGRVAYALTFVNDFATAARLVERAQLLAEEIGADVPWVARMNDDTRRRVREQLDDDAVAAARAEGRAWTVDEAADLAREACEAASSALTSARGRRH